MSAKSKVAKGSASPRSKAPVSAIKSRGTTSSTKKSVRLEAEDDTYDLQSKQSSPSSAGSDHLSERDTENEESPNRAQQDEENRREEQLEMTIRMAGASRSIAEKFPVKKVCLAYSFAASCLDILQARQAIREAQALSFRMCL
eukprot:2427075-Rhodomonas_salina.1